MSNHLFITHMDQLRALRKGAQVTRYHTIHVNTRETNAAHSHGVALLCIVFWPDASDNLVRAALLHDLAEHLVGDLPHLAKKNNLALNAAYREAEGNAEQALGIAASMMALSQLEHDQLRVADMADAFLYGEDEYNRGNMVTGATIMQNAVVALDHFPNANIPFWFKSYIHSTLREVTG